MKWEERPLGEVLCVDLDQVPTDPSETYQLAGVYGFGRGLFVRGPLSGANTTYKGFNRLHAGQFVISVPKAWEGAIAEVTEDFDGLFLSPVFPTFTPDSDALLCRYLAWFFRRPASWEQMRSKSKGIGARRESLSSEQFLSINIPLPPVKEQRKIVAKLDAAAERIARIEAAQADNAEDFDRLLESLLFDNPSAAPTPMRELVIPRAPDTKVLGDQIYDFAGVYSFGRGVFSSITKTGLDFAYTALTQVRAGEFTYPKLMAWEGAFGIIPPECDGCFVSPEFPVFGVRQDLVFPELLDAYFRSPRVWPEIAAISSGTNARRRRLQPSSFLNYRFPLPSREAQKQIRDTLEARTRLRAAQDSRAADLAALMPSLLDRAFKGEL